MRDKTGVSGVNPQCKIDTNWNYDRSGGGVIDNHYASLTAHSSEQIFFFHPSQLMETILFSGTTLVCFFVGELILHGVFFPCLTHKKKTIRQTGF